jgi:hypothetical protein
MPKRLQLVHELIPNAAAFGVLVDPAFPGNPSLITDLLMAARTLGRQLVIMNAQTDSDLEPAFATLSQQRVGAVLVSVSNFYISRMERLAALAARYKLPAIYPFREFGFAGGLMSYGTSIGYTYHQLGIYAGRILKGEKPADLPVEQITKIERHQPQDRQGARRYHPGNAVGHRRRGDPMMQRREFIAGLGSVAAWPVVAHAQQAERMRRIGVLLNAAATEVGHQGYLAAFVQEMRRLGWSEGQNLRMDAALGLTWRTISDRQQPTSTVF